MRFRGRTEAPLAHLRPDRATSSSSQGVFYAGYVDVGVRKLTAKLSAMLQPAAGHVIMVSNRGRPAVIPGPPLGTVDLSAAVEAGWVTPPTSTGLGPTRRYRSTVPVLDTLGEDRGE
jgi:antitoxin (DNA-binding transcriptional repressor) of toxin-antitoxin stability system